MIERSPRAPVSRSRPFSATADERLLGEHQLDPVEGEEALELLHERVAGLDQDRHEVLARELVHRRHHRQAADELGDQPVLDQVLGQAVLEDLARVALGLGLDRRGEADPFVADAPLDHLVEVRERAAADEQHVGGVDRQELLVGVLAPPLGGTDAWVPSRIFSSACWTPSPETSRVIDGLSALRAILSTSSM